MERLTFRVDNGIDEIYFSNPDDPEGLYTIIELDNINMEKVARRLAEYEDSGLSPEKVQELTQAKADGKLMVLPCKVGDMVYIIGEKYRAGRMETWINTGKFSTNDIAKIGKTVFLTHEEAEKALVDA